MKIAIVTACDSRLFYLLQGLILSIREKAKRPVDICVLDIGLTDNHRAWVEQHVAKVAEPSPKYQFETEYPLKPYMNAQVCRAYLREYFPGYELYFWMDADVWIQDWKSVEHYIRVVQNGSEIAITPEIDRAYHVSFANINNHIRFFHQCYSDIFGRDDADRYASIPMMNSGVFCMKPQSPMWQKFRSSMQLAYKARPHHLSEQLAINRAIHLDNAETGSLKAGLLPATHNWMCNFTRPMRDMKSGDLYTPLVPHMKIGIVHLAADEFRNEYKRKKLLYRQGSYLTD